MSALQEITKIGIIAGGGDVPHALARRCGEQGADVFMAAIEGHCGAIDEGVAHASFKLGRTGSMIKQLQQQGIRDLVLIGSLKRPNWSELIPDFKTMQFIAKAGLSAKGDDDLLRKLRVFLEGEGFTLHGVHHFLPELLASAGVMGTVKPDSVQLADVTFGFSESQRLGAADIGQAVIVRGGQVIAEEDSRGTNALLRRDIDMAGGVLVKTCKPQQDMDLDLPTVGLRTVQLAHETGLAGVVLHAGRSLLMDRAEAIAFADEHRMFMMGIE